VTYSDNEISVKMITEWKKTKTYGDRLDKSTVEKLALEHGYATRISQRAFNMSVKKTGFAQRRVFDKDTNSYPLAWVWEAGGIIPDDKEDAPF